MSPLGISCASFRNKLNAMGRCLASTLTVLVGLSAGLSCPVTTAAHAAGGLGCHSHPLAVASHPIVLDSEDLDNETPSSATPEQEQAVASDDDEGVPLALKQSKNDAAVAGKYNLSAEDSLATNSAGLATFNEQKSQRKTNLAAAAAFTAASSAITQQGFYDNFDSRDEADVDGLVDTARGERISDAEWGEVLEDPKTANMYAVLVARGKAC